MDGLLKNLDSVIYNCCLDGNFHPEPAIQHMSGSLGYITLSEDNPYTSHVQKMEELYQLVGESTPPLKAQTTRGIQPEDKDKIQELGRPLGPAAERESGSGKNKRANWKRKKAQFSHFTGLDMPFDEIIKGEYIKVRFGFLPKASYAPYDGGLCRESPRPLRHMQRGQGRLLGHLFYSAAQRRRDRRHLRHPVL